MSSEAVRAPVVAGQFYPGDAPTLSQEVGRYLGDAQVEPAPDRTAAIVVPHAGYIYSGPTAACGYARVRGKRPHRVLLLGCSHRALVPTASVYRSGAFACPTGLFPIDAPFADRVAERVRSVDARSHAFEHSLEVQLPFLSAIFGAVPIVPILFGSPSAAWHADVGRVLAEMADPDDLVVASTDLSHYAREEEANRLDRSTILHVLEMDPERLRASVDAGESAMCGASAVVAAMGFALAQGATEAVLLDYRTSAAASGDFTRVVGYAAVSMERPA